MTDKHFMQAKADEQLKTRKKEDVSSESEMAQFDHGPTSEAVQRALSNPSAANLTPAVMTSLQRSHGNQFVAQLARQQGKSSTKLTAPIQMKMSVTAADDHHEHEADAVAQNVVSKISSGEVQREREQALQAKRIQREGEEEEEMMMKRIDRQDEEEEMQMKRIDRQEEEEEMQMKRIDRQEEEEMMAKRIDRKSSKDGFDVDGDLENRIENSRGGGQSLDDNTRQNMEGAFGADFSDVRVHTGSEASELSSSVQARAFTTGSDIYFNEGEYNPGSSQGQELLAHELTHTIQQGAVSQTKRKEESE